MPPWPAGRRPHRGQGRLRASHAARRSPCPPPPPGLLGFDRAPGTFFPRPPRRNLARLWGRRPGGAGARAATWALGSRRQRAAAAGCPFPSSPPPRRPPGRFPPPLFGPGKAQPRSWDSWWISSPGGRALGPAAGGGHALPLLGPPSGGPSSLQSSMRGKAVARRGASVGRPPRRFGRCEPAAALLPPPNLIGRLGMGHFGGGGAEKNINGGYCYLQCISELY